MPIAMNTVSFGETLSVGPAIQPALIKRSPLPKKFPSWEIKPNPVSKFPSITPGKFPRMI